MLEVNDEHDGLPVLVDGLLQVERDLHKGGDGPGKNTGHGLDLVPLLDYDRLGVTAAVTENLENIIL